MLRIVDNFHAADGGQLPGLPGKDKRNQPTTAQTETECAKRGGCDIWSNVIGHGVYAKYDLITL